MKDHWEKLGTDTQAFKEKLQELLEMMPQSARFYTAQNAINKAWKNLEKSHNAMDEFIAPVKSVEVKCPMLTDATFSATWAMWKDYLNEQHGIVMRSRAELMALKRLVEISENNPGKAAKYLEFAMARIDKNFYKVNEAETIAVNPDSHRGRDTQTTGKTVIKLPAKYQQESIKNEKL